LSQGKGKGKSKSEGRPQRRRADLKALLEWSKVHRYFLYCKSKEKKPWISNSNVSIAFDSVQVKEIRKFKLLTKPPLNRTPT
jgi:hypothetical protein